MLVASVDVVKGSKPVGNTMLLAEIIFDLAVLNGVILSTAMTTFFFIASNTAPISKEISEMMINYQFIGTSTVFPSYQSPLFILIHFVGASYATV